MTGIGHQGSASITQITGSPYQVGQDTGCRGFLRTQKKGLLGEGFSSNPVLVIVSSTHSGQAHVLCFTRKEAGA